MDPYDVFLLVLGGAIVASAVLPKRLRSLPLSLPVIHVMVGFALYLLIDGLPQPDPREDDAVTERLSEVVVIISLAAAGLKIDRRVGLRRWAPTWRLLALAMPLTIAATALLAFFVLDLPAASAVLLGAVIAPTDPVLASEIQVEGPNTDTEDEARLALTAEAGLNDALAFPFTNAAIAMAAADAWFRGWLIDDVVIKLTSGVLVGYVCGRALGWLAFRGPEGSEHERASDAIAAIGSTLLVYALAELAHGYGFLAVFVAAVVLRDHERGHERHTSLHEATETVEQLGSALLMVLVGGAVAVGGLAALEPLDAVVAVLVLAVIRPIAGWLSLIRSRVPARHRWVVAVFGIRGMGSVYYLAHAAGAAEFQAIDRLWAVTLLVILLSVVLHGATAGRVVDRHLDLEPSRASDSEPGGPSSGAPG